jgi:hypothetical protein
MLHWLALNQILCLIFDIVGGVVSVVLQEDVIVGTSGLRDIRVVVVGLSGGGRRLEELGRVALLGLRSGSIGLSNVGVVVVSVIKVRFFSGVVVVVIVGVVVELVVGVVNLLLLLGGGEDSDDSESSANHDDTDDEHGGDLEDVAVSGGGDVVVDLLKNTIVLSVLNASVDNVRSIIDSVSEVWLEDEVLDDPESSGDEDESSQSESYSLGSVTPTLDKEEEVEDEGEGQDGDDSETEALEVGHEVEEVVLSASSLLRGLVIFTFESALSFNESATIEIVGARGDDVLERGGEGLSESILLINKGLRSVRSILKVIIDSIVVTSSSGIDLQGVLFGSCISVVRVETVVSVESNGEVLNEVLISVGRGSSLNDSSEYFSCRIGESSIEGLNLRISLSNQLIELGILNYLVVENGAFKERVDRNTSRGRALLLILVAGSFSRCKVGDFGGSANTEKLSAGPKED